jgi:hypothetical protein
MTHTQLIYLVLVVAAFLIFSGSLLKATITSLSASPRAAGGTSPSKSPQKTMAAPTRPR